MPQLFGTNGIRGVVNEDMSSDLGMNIGKAIGSWLKGKEVAIGTDTRISNHMLKDSVSAGLMATGSDIIDLGEAPTPAIQYYVRERSDFGVAITASHNPPQFNGIKCIDSDGTELIRWKEEEIEDIYYSEKFDLVEWSRVGEKWTRDSIRMYKRAVKEKVDVQSIERSDLRVIVDCANGSGCYSTPYILRELGCSVTTLNSQPDGTFPGHNSEPTRENLSDLISMVKKTDCDLGVAHDGDADRAIFVDENGEFLHGDKTLTLVAKEIVNEREGGLVVTPVSTSSSVEDVVRDMGGRVVYTAVGSPIVAREMKERGAVFGGEENGGLIFADHQFCRDAAMSTVKIVELVSKRGPLSELIADLPDYALDKRGVRCPDELKEDLLEELIDVFRDEEYDDTDGLKIYYDEGWVLIRPSGTEPKYRIYSEAEDEETADRLGKEHQERVEESLENVV